MENYKFQLGFFSLLFFARFITFGTFNNQNYRYVQQNRTAFSTLLLNEPYKIQTIKTFDIHNRKCR